jgi:hypothetical protein
VRIRLTLDVRRDRDEPDVEVRADTHADTESRPLPSYIGFRAEE